MAQPSPLTCALRVWDASFGCSLTVCMTDVQARRTSNPVVARRFSQHTEQCPSCLAAYKAAERVQKVAAAAGALLMVACVSSASIRGLAWATTIPGIGASLSCAIWFASSWLVKEFTFVDYSHEQHHTSKGS